MQITFPPHLPVSARRADLAEAIRDHQVVVVAGETGSGKTTQLPKICLELGRGRGGRDGMIGHTQPRRIAARTVAERIAEELGEPLGGPGGGAGGAVGYQVRFTDRTSAGTRVKVMTDGILLAEMQRDRMLRRYDTLIIDEAHERSLNIDFLLGYLKRLLPRRPDLKVVITSATIDPQRFAAHFADRQGRPAPVIEVSGRTFPVEVRYRPLLEFPEADEDGEPVVRDQTEAIVDAVRELTGEGPGDVLVFLPGEREIRDTADALASASGLDAERRRGLEITPLYSRLSAADQHRVFEPHTGRRVVLATNVAETSLTVPGIRYVVDTGLARISRYSVRTKVQRLPIEPISQASARQRSGRCGRTEAGIAVRLWSEEEQEARPEFTEPEILRTNLASVVLQMAALGLGDLASFPFVEPPDRRNVAAGVQLLEELGALRGPVLGEGPPGPSGPVLGESPPRPSRDRRRDATPAQGPQLTQLGRRLARLPVDPRLGRMVLEAERLGCVREVIVIAAALSLQDPRERPGPDQPALRTQAEQAHARFTAEGSDFLAWLNLWRHLREQQRELSGSAFRRMCRREFLTYLRVREWQDFESQLRQVAKEMGVEVGRPADVPDADGIHQALLSGLLSHIGLLDEREKPAPGERRRGPREYLGARGARFAIFPGSSLRGKPPPLVMAGELVETSRLWARQNAAIRPEWAEHLGAHLVKRSYSEPHWSTRRAAVMAYERVTLYGVPLVADRLIPYGRVDRELARELFIRHALVQGEWPALASGRQRFYTENRRLLEEAEELEHRARRRDIVVDEQTLFDFYEARVGSEVVSGAHFDSWWKAERRRRPDLLTFDRSMLTHDTAPDVSERDFPSTWVSETAAFPIAYTFAPGEADDGLTIDVPVTTLNRVGEEDFSWLVPGLREELVTSLLRSLPKRLRTSFVPAPNTARAFLSAVPAGEEPLLTALERYLRSTTGVVVPRDAWDWDKVAPHLRPTYRVLDDEERERARGKDLDALKGRLLPTFDEAVAQVGAEAGRSATGQTRWTFGAVPVTDTWTRAGHQVLGHPALVDEGSTVGLGVFGTADEAEARHRLGVRRLVLLALEGDRSVRTLLDGLSNTDKLALAGSPYPSVGALLDDCRLAVVTDVVDGQGLPRDEAAFASLVTAAREAVSTLLRETLDLVLRTLDAWRAVDRLLSGRADLRTLPSLTDMKAHLARLVGPGFVGEAGTARLRHYPRYLAALAQRRERLDDSGAALDRDRRLMAQVGDLQDAVDHRTAALAEGRPPGAGLRRARWLLEEYRVSLWAQQLGTAEPVSDARIRRALEGS